MTGYELDVLELGERVADELKRENRGRAACYRAILDRCVPCWAVPR